MRKLIRWTALGAVLLAGAGLSAMGQTDSAVQAPATVQAAPSGGGTIKGTVKAGTVPLPGVAVTATNTLTGKKYATTTDITGSFAMVISRNGRYVVKAELAAFATETKEVLIDSSGSNGGKPEQVTEFGMQLASRVAREEAQQAGAARASAASIAGGLGRGTQALSVSGDSDLADASAGAGVIGAQMP
ncbi:MAG: carboxypeptidase-like regulatory domain-containing protein, partial [Edaphobacter sp.]